MCWTRWRILCDWVIGCAAHNKDLSDGEMGVLKNIVNRVNLEFLASDESRQDVIDTVVKAVEYLCRHCCFPKEDLSKKHGVGIYRRFIHYVALHTISRLIPLCKTLTASKSHHQVMDVKDAEGKVLWRLRPCHQCKGCMDLDADAIINECKHKDRCGQAEYKQIQFNVKPTLVVTRAAARKAAAVMAEKTRAGDFLAFKSTGSELPFELGEARRRTASTPSACGSGCRWKLAAAATSTRRPRSSMA